MARWPRIERAARATRRASPFPPSHGWVFAAALGAVACLARADSSETDARLAFARHGEPVVTASPTQLRERVAPTTVRVHEPYEKSEARFRALRFDRVLDAVYGPRWRDEEEILFTCRDGYQPTVPVARVLAHRAWLAFDREGGDGFTILKHESGAVQTVELGPFYLVWENLDDDRILQEADYGWPYQLVGIDLIRTQDRFPAMTPPDGASSEVRAGFAAFRIHCSRCHKLNGEGGSIGPELVAGASPVEYRERDWLRTWIEDPSRIAPEARMPALNPALPDRARAIDEILAYLEAMAKARSETREP